MKTTLSLLLLVVCFSTQTLLAQRGKNFNLTHQVAIEGYDPVAYFKHQKAVKGSKQFAVNAEGVVYYLSSAENKALFLANYKQYEPQYGGWCAYAMGAKGEKVEVDPETFKITDGKLFLFYNAYFNNTLHDWNKNEKQLKSQADQNWQKLNH